MNAGFALRLKNAAVFSCEGLDGRKKVRFVEREAVPQSVLCGNLLKRSTDGWEGNLNAIS